MVIGRRDKQSYQQSGILIWNDILNSSIGMSFYGQIDSKGIKILCPRKRIRQALAFVRLNAHLFFLPVRLLTSIMRQNRKENSEKAEKILLLFQKYDVYFPVSS